MIDNIINTADLPDEWYEAMHTISQEIVDTLLPLDPRLAIIILQSCVYHHIYNRVKEASWSTIIGAFMSTAPMTFERWKEEDKEG